MIAKSTCLSFIAAIAFAGISGCTNDNPSMVEVDSRPIDREMAAVAAELGFTVERKVIEVDGLCGTCRAKNPGAVGSDASTVEPIQTA